MDVVVRVPIHNFEDGDAAAAAARVAPELVAKLENMVALFEIAVDVAEAHDGNPRPLDRGAIAAARATLAKAKP